MSQICLPKGLLQVKGDKLLDCMMPRAHVSHVCTCDSAQLLATRNEAEQVQEVTGVPEGKS